MVCKPVFLFPAFVLLAALTVEGAQDSSPRPTGLVERTGVRLMLLDVAVTDKQGNPIRGLVKGDFCKTDSLRPPGNFLSHNPAESHKV